MATPTSQLRLWRLDFPRSDGPALDVCAPEGKRDDPFSPGVAEVATGWSDCQAVLVKSVDLQAFGRVAQWESARFTRERSLVRNQPCPCPIGPGFPGPIAF